MTSWAAWWASSLVACLAFFAVSEAHIAAWTKGMYCSHGLSNNLTREDSNEAAVPIFNQPKDVWWMHGECRDYPPPKGEFLDIPANGHFTVDLAENRAFTSLSLGGRFRTAWPDGKNHPNGYSVDNLGGGELSGSGCLHTPNLHTKGEADAAGTVFAIAYKSDIMNISMEELVVFTVAPNTPYMLEATYEVPDLPACPSEGCICAWGWVPNHCGEDNIYMHPYRCRVTGARPHAQRPASARAPVWCENRPLNECMRGPKQMVITHQLEANNVDPQGKQADGGSKSPGYNLKMGFLAGAQHDIFDDPYADGTPIPLGDKSPYVSSVTDQAPSLRGHISLGFAFISSALLLPFT